MDVEPGGAFGAVDGLDLAALPIALDCASQAHNQRHNTVKPFEHFSIFVKAAWFRALASKQVGDRLG